MLRRSFLSGAVAFLATPSIITTSTRALADIGPAAAPSGVFEVSANISGYRVDSIREHSINGYWVRGRKELVAVDAFWRIPEVHEALENLPTATGLSVGDLSLIMITHPHSDHYGGLTTYRQATENATAITSETAHRVIRNDEHGFYANRLEDMPQDIPPEIPVPSAGIRHNISIDAAGFEVVPSLYRGNEAIETAVLYLVEDGVLFTGDLVNSKTTPVLYQGGLDGWIDQLKSLRSDFPNARMIAPGHGAPGDFDELVTEQIRYLTTFSRLVEAALDDGDGSVNDAGLETIKTGIRDSFPDWRTSAGVPSLDRLIELNVGWTLRGWRIASSGAGNARAFREN